jgi:3-deoxy-7-phosphoheptulonate synthase
MIIILKKGTTQKQIEHVEKKITDMGLRPHTSTGIERTVIGAIGDERLIKVDQLRALNYVEDVHPVMKPYRLVSREFKSQNTIIKVGDVKIGSEELVLMAGPCSIEDKDQIMETARSIKSAGGHILRGGAFKPRTSPHQFQGMGEKGLIFLAEAGEEMKMPIVTEVMDTRDVSLVSEYADILQIGTRNMHNYPLLKEVGKTEKPVLLKRGMSADLHEFLLAAEYIMSEGNEKIILCERGIRTFVDYSRNTLDLNIIPVIKQESHLPIIVDPSHGTGKRMMVEPMSKGAIAVGADGLMVEVHKNPENAISDADQTLSTLEFEKLIKDLRPFAKASGRTL